MTTALLDPADLAELGSIEPRVPLELIDPNPHNPRRNLTEIEALADNIRQHGLLQPVTVRRKGDRYELLGGHRRFAAYQALAKREPHEDRWKAIPYVIRNQDDDEKALEALISGQVHIVEWPPREEAALLDLLVQSGRSPSEVAKALNKSPSWFSKRLGIYNDSVLSGYVQTGRLKRGVAEELLPVKDVDTKKRIAEEAATDHLSQDQVKGRVRALRLDIQLSHLDRQIREVIDTLESIDLSKLPTPMYRNLMLLFSRLELVARHGGNPRRMPTVDEKPSTASARGPRRSTRRSPDKPRSASKSAARSA